MTASAQICILGGNNQPVVQAAHGCRTMWSSVVPIAAPVVVQQETVFGDYKMI